MRLTGVLEGVDGAAGNSAHQREVCHFQTPNKSSPRRHPWPVFCSTPCEIHHAVCCPRHRAGSPAGCPASAGACFEGALPRTHALHLTSCSLQAARGIASSAARGQQISGDVIGIDLGTTNSCVAIMEVCSLACGTWRVSRGGRPRQASLPAQAVPHAPLSLLRRARPHVSLRTARVPARRLLSWPSPRTGTDWSVSQHADR